MGKRAALSGPLADQPRSTMIEAQSRSARVLWRIVRWLLTAVVLLAAALFLANASDERLSTQAQATLAPPESRYHDSENLLVLLAGLDAPADKSPLTVVKRTSPPIGAW